jgi:DNA-directed RNA polymerase subunit RPC12/RpoP
MSIQCGTCGTSLWFSNSAKGEVVPCPTCARNRFVEERLLEHFEVMKKVLAVLDKLSDYMGRDKR